MKEVKKYVENRFYEFWDDLETVEMEQFYAFDDYFKFIENAVMDFKVTKSDYTYYKKLFMTKFIDYFHEAYSSLLLGNYNAYSCAMRIIIENYVCLCFIKKYKKEKVWNDWYIFSLKRFLAKKEKDMVRNVNDKNFSDRYKRFKVLYDSECKRLKIDDSKYNIYDSYGWLCDVIDPNPNTKRYDFRYVSSKIDEKIYVSYDELSDNIHNIDYLIKNKANLMESLCNYLVILFNFTDEMVREYNFNIFKSNEYRILRANLMDKLVTCFKEWEVLPDE